MYRIALCDDDAQFATAFQNKVRALLDARGVAAELVTFSTAELLLHQLNSGARFDLLFLDIFLGEENGYQFARKLREEGVEADLVFITSTPEYAVAGYEVSPLRYLLKPVQGDRLEEALGLFLRKRESQRVLLRYGGRSLALALNDILYCEVYDHDTMLHLVSGETQHLRMPLGKLESQLAASCFARSHQSYLVNMDYIESVVRYELTLTNGITLPISQPKYMSLQRRFVQYVGEKLSPTV